MLALYLLSHLFSPRSHISETPGTVFFFACWVGHTYGKSQGVEIQAGLLSGDLQGLG